MQPSTTNSTFVPLFIPGFLLLAFGSLGDLLVLLTISSEPIAMDPGPYHLLASGWGASIVFAAAYHFAPIMAGAPLWSPSSGWIHLAFHACGLGLLIRSQFTGEGAATGAMLMTCGAGLFVLNFTITAGIKNQWTPANLLFLTSLLWLAVELVVTTHMAVNPKPRGLVRSPEWTTRLAESALVIGFLWQATMAMALEAVRKYLPPSRSPGPMAWIGFGALNLGLASLFWLPDAGWSGPVQSALLVTGLFMIVLALAADLSAAGPQAAPVAGFSLGLAAAALLLAACWPFANPLSNALYAVIHLLGVTWICLAARLVPFAFGNGRNGGFVAEHRMPSLIFGATVSNCLLGVATLLGSIEGMGVGAALLLSTIVWWLFTLSPAWCRACGSACPSVAKAVEA
jgi:hypothetical protein